MKKEVISDRQGISLMVLFIIGTSIIYASGIKAKQDMWIAIILSLIAAFPLAMMYVRLHSLFPGKTLFDICELCFGKFTGKIITVLYVWFIFHTGVSVILNLNVFITTVSLFNTPPIVPLTCILLLCAWSVKEGIEVLGRWSSLFVIVLVTFIISTALFLVPQIKINNILPILNNGMNPVLKGAFGTYAFPFTQIIVFTVAFSNFETKKSPFNIYYKSMLIGGFLILLISLMNIMVLGIDAASRVYYPSHASALRVDIGELIQRVEIIISAGFVIGAFVKGSIYLLATCKGISKLFDCRDYRFIVIPVALLMISLSNYTYYGIMDYFYWILELWTVYYALPFQMVAPVIIWIFAEIKHKRLITNSNVT
ncbi:GerAB/ArcD/ProY family transporter [Oceanirhabdus sp. W0125-5]|uniref:GerAB/ArcD/ProY family transporter n=1 Tax=Oceanirhabdus sp. W0125-5 TaxID=2999116 RepID=UPI0022F2EE93|nr:endospore germination permease [Oceanirhabdus sp. W0125-5]WBW99145.1 endospore germination permease [Oceanirhabdus sp. W0125-5]